MSEINYADKTKTTTIQTPRPSSPRKFFARIYGHLEQPKAKAKESQGSESESSSDVEIGESEGRQSVQVSPVWQPPHPLPLCPRPVLLPHQQLAFGAGLAAFRLIGAKTIKLFRMKWAEHGGPESPKKVDGGHGGRGRPVGRGVRVGVI
ncbi:jg24146 [Pararge aegeria aegeria]|uniref:Jg24146 protein n=1 Tax=Pararge aegeria aegeria TaxID=348720 RepID=A0A8S4RK78_9NEOP|nr:jg24146 [Pararge aegeria aegeria]